MGKRGPKPMYENVEEMQKKIDDYFRDCAGTLLTDDSGNPILRHGTTPIYVGRRPPTMTGLAMALGFATRKSIFDYRKKGEFELTLTVARSRVEMYAEERLFDRDSVQGAKFSLLHNFGWSAGTKQKESGTGSIVRIIESSAGAT